MTAEFACDQSCAHCTRYQSEETTYVKVPSEGNPEDEEYMMHISTRVIRHGGMISDPYEKSLFVIKYYNLLLSNTFFLTDHRDLARELILVYKFDHIRSQQFETALSTLGIDGHEWLMYFDEIVRDSFSGWGPQVLSCGTDCEHCLRYLETEDGIIENYLFGDMHEFVTEPIFRTSGDEYVGHMFGRIINLSTRQKTTADRYMLYLVAADFLLSNADFAVTHSSVRYIITSFLEEVFENFYDVPKLQSRVSMSFDIESWIDHFRNLPRMKTPVVTSHTDHEDLIFKQVPEIGVKYVKCTLKEDHIMDYEVMVKMGDIERLKCVYCQSSLHREIYEQI